MPIAGVSFVGADRMLKLLQDEERAHGGGLMENLLNTQVVPHHRDVSIPAVRDSEAAIDRLQPTAPPGVADGSDRPFSPSRFGSLEGCVSARALVQVLQKAGRNLTRQSAFRAAESRGVFDLGVGARAKLTPSRHQVLDAVWFTVATADGWKPTDKPAAVSGATVTLARAGDAPRTGRRGFLGLAPKLLAASLAVLLGVPFAMSTRATSQLAEQLTASFESKGEAIALALASAAEQGGGTDFSVVQGSIDANKILRGVRYLFVTDSRNHATVHTFSPSLPSGLEAKNPLLLVEDLHGRRVKVARGIEVPGLAGVGRASNVAAPIGDRTQKIAFASDDEIGDLAPTFAEMVARLREIPTEIGESTKLLADSVRQLGRSASEQGETVNTQASALRETQVTAQKIKETSLLAAQKTEAVPKYADRADTGSKTGELAVEQSLKAPAEIRARVVEIAERIASLGERTLQVGNVTQTVKNLADRSHVLAVNAAIEAVRSGEHGRGFAVVAREIRSLADRSVEATKRMREILEDIGAAIRAAVSIPGQGARSIDFGLAQVRTSGETLSELSGIVRENAAAVRQIHAAVGQQKAGIAQVLRAVADRSNLRGDTVKRLEATDRSIQTSSEVSARLVQIVGRFHV